MASRSSVVALGLSSQPSCSTPLSAQRNSFPGLHLPSQSLLLGQDSFFKSSHGYVAVWVYVGLSPGLALCLSLSPLPYSQGHTDGPGAHDVSAPPPYCYWGWAALRIQRLSTHARVPAALPGVSVIRVMPWVQSCSTAATPFLTRS